MVDEKQSKFLQNGDTPVGFGELEKEGVDVDADEKDGRDDCDGSDKLQKKADRPRQTHQHVQETSQN